MVDSRASQKKKVIIDKLEYLYSPSSLRFPYTPALQARWHGTELVLASTLIASKPVTEVEIKAAGEHVQNLEKYRSDMQDKYRKVMKWLSRNREEYTARGGIQDGDLVMREVLNPKSKLHHRHDGPFVAIASTGKEVYQLCMFNGYVLI